MENKKTKPVFTVKGNMTVKKEEREPWSFCKTPEEGCTMNYCDDNGCMNRERVRVGVSGTVVDSEGDTITNFDLKSVSITQPQRGEVSIEDPEIRDSRMWKGDRD